MPVVIVAILIGLLFVVLRRPAVVRPPTDTSAPKGNAPTATPGSDDPMQELVSELKTEMSNGATKRVAILKGNKIVGWTVTRQSKQISLSPEDLRGMGLDGSTEQLARDLFAKLSPGSPASNAPPEAQLQYPGSSLLVGHLESRRTSDGGPSRDVHKTTLATEADGAQLLAWYREWLLGHGWQPSPSTGTVSDSSQEYSRASEHFRLAVADPATLAPVLAVPIPAGTKTVYEVEYSNASTPPPSP